MDFDKNMVGVIGINFKFHLIRSWNNLTGYEIFPDGRCEKYPVPANSVYDRCLPPTAKYMGSSFFGLDGSLPVTSWEFSNMGRKMVASFTNVPGQPNVPVVRKAMGDFEAWAYSFVSWNSTISDPQVMNIPGNCVERKTKKEG
ncbi:uncharacterized protein LOC101845874 [Aplysia californica]|uniref:Uncharacterized protein LOC101845874 n=1 Tax=Aplysia californica TaxID=6500 RepID=A0ABM1A8H3_APLCA|nr:uncharacterized protein LOC101845874 [Aplysia californica]